MNPDNCGCGNEQCGVHAKEMYNTHSQQELQIKLYIGIHTDNLLMYVYTMYMCTYACTSKCVLVTSNSANISSFIFWPFTAERVPLLALARSIMLYVVLWVLRIGLRRGEWQFTLLCCHVLHAVPLLAYLRL